MQFVVRHGWTLDATFLEVSIANSGQGALRVIANVELDHWSNTTALSTTFHVT